MDANEEIVRQRIKQIVYDGDPLYGYELRLGPNVTELAPRYHGIKAKSEAEVWRQGRLYTDRLRARIEATEAEIEFLLDLPVSGEIMGRIIERAREALAELKNKMN